MSQRKNWSKWGAELFGLDKSVHTGWGILPIDNDAGEEFIYFLHADGSVTVNNN